MKHLIKIALLLLASVAAYLVYGFTSSVAPQAVAALATGSLVSTYIGLAFAEIPDTQQHNAVRVATAAMIIEALYGMLFVLGQQYPAFFAAPPLWAGVPLAALHGASFSVLAFLVSLFVFHAQRSPAQEPAQPAHGDALDAVRLLVQELRSVPALPAPQEQFARPEPAHIQRTQPAVMPETCPGCAAAASTMQLRTAAQHNGWKCKQCGKKVGV